MALDGNRLGTAIYNALVAGIGVFGTLTPAQQSEALAKCQALGTCIVDEFQDNAQVVVASVSGVTTGSGTSGPGTGTIT